MSAKQVVKVDVPFLQQILNYLQSKPYVEVHQLIDIILNNQPEPEEKTVQVEVESLQYILNYLQRRPYEEVHELVDILIGKNPQPSQRRQGFNDASMCNISSEVTTNE